MTTRTGHGRGREFNLAEVHEAIAAAYPDRECLVHGDRRLSWSDLTARSRRLANYLRSRGLGEVVDRSRLEPWESGQDHIALFLYNCVEYLEGMLGAFKARIVPFNVNYRYVAEELAYVFRDARPRAIVYNGAFASQVAAVLEHVPEVDVLVRVDDGSGDDLLPGAVDYEEALASASPEPVDAEWSPDDVYMLYTGGTTGMPKGVLWRQGDLFVAAMSGKTRSGEFHSIDEVVARASKGGYRLLPLPPLMHGASQWMSFTAFHVGGSVVLPTEVRRFDPADAWATVERERATVVSVVGDAFARPLLDALDQHSYDLSSLRTFASSGARLSSSVKEELLARVPTMTILDAVGSSESGIVGDKSIKAKTEIAADEFVLAPNAAVLSEDRRRVLEPGSPELGWLANSGRVPLGYLGDAAKTKLTFPSIDGVRYTVPGDRVVLQADGSMDFRGRDSVTVNSGGEKIFVEEVEHAIANHAGVADVVVCGRPSERWGEEVVALVQLRSEGAATAEDLLSTCAQHLARYKLPKEILWVDHVQRSPSGKADYAWAKRVASERGDV
jgi:acyl-CoA synthetase (AMP-forming)/AMP-acid ligase II